MNGIKDKKEWLCRCVALIVVPCMFAWLYSIAPFIYSTNDDVFMKTIASGEVLGIPEAHLLHMGYPVGMLIAGLYQIYPVLPWYGLFLCIPFGVTMYIVLFNILKKINNIVVAFATVIISFLCVYSFLFIHIAEIQFTTVAAMTGAGALFLFIVTPVEVKAVQYIKQSVWIIILSMWTFCIRRDVLFMVMPFIAFVFLGKYLELVKEKRKSLCCMLGVWVACLLVVWFADSLAYSSTEWREFKEYNSARASIYDYNNYPDYEKNNEIYQRLNISETSYIAASTRYGILLDENINKESMEVLAEVRKEEKSRESGQLLVKIKTMVDTFLEYHIFSYMDRPLNLLVYIMYFLFLVIAFFTKKMVAVRDIMFVFAPRMIVWIYLLYNGRILFRVSQGVYLVELMCLIAIALNRKLWESKVLWYISMAGVLFVTIRFGVPKAEGVGYEVNGRIRFNKGYEEMEEYFLAHPDNLYYLDMHSFSSCTEKVLQTGVNKYGNYMLMGSWLPNSPWYEEKLESEGIEDVAHSVIDNENVYVVFMKTDVTDIGYLKNYYQEKFPDTTFELCEEVLTSSDVVFEIWKGRQKGE